MPEQDLSQIEKVFHAVLDVPSSDREDFLKRTCNGDNSLYAEVWSLISAFDSRNGFIHEPALNLGFEILSRSTEHSLIGKKYGSYKVLSQLGKGGMGEVYLAEDLKLGRKVALKFLSPEFIGDSWAKRLLVKEAQAAAMLDHQNICSVYGIEESDGYTFIVMQYVEGATLADLVKSTLIVAEEKLQIAKQIVEALAAAHAHGIIHRDIKPRNIMVTPASVVKVLDFGLAKTLHPTTKLDSVEDSINQFRQTGLVPGTIIYMSPEQLRGEVLDYLSDVFSLGTVLIELISGTNPFARKSQAETISAILSDSPPELEDQQPRLKSLDRIARKCLEKQKENRYQSAAEVLLALNGSVKPMPFTWSRVLIALAFIALVLIGVFVYLSKPTSKKLAILPFANRTGDVNVDDISRGMSSSLIDRLSRTNGLFVLKDTIVSGYQNRENDPQSVGEELNVDAILVGEITKSADSIVLHTRLVRTSDGATMWETSDLLDTQEMLRAQQDLSTKLALSMNASLPATSATGKVVGQTDNPEAFRLYLQGRGALEKGKNDVAIEAFQRATNLDSAYALAWSGLADSYSMKPTVAYGAISPQEAGTKATSAARRAVEAGTDLAEPHISKGIVKLRYEWNWAEAEQEFKRAIEIDPTRAAAHVWYANLLTTMGRYEEAISETRKAKDLDPFNPNAVMSLGRAYYRAREFDKSIDYLTRVLKENPTNWNAEYVLGYAYLKKGMLSEAITTFEKVGIEHRWLAAAPLGYAYAKNGMKEKAVDILREMEAQSRKTEPGEQRIPPQERAIIYIGLGDHDNAFAWLEKAYAERFPSIISLTTEPIFDDLRPDPRFVELARRINLTP